ncbi:MAG: hypothetical protein AB7Q17_14980, partial [Phycisphaerae bacterium]
ADSTAIALITDRSRPCFHPELGDFDISCLTPEELAAVRADSDNDGRTNLEELMMGMDPYDRLDGPDIDGDGIPNGEDDDVDGDGVLNKHDFDVDGDGIFNDHDSDIDADGLIGDDDGDDDGDGLSDRHDLDDDGDDDPDDEDEDDDEDMPKEKLEDLIDRLKTGMLTDQDKGDIANEIVDRLGTFSEKTRVQAILVDVVGVALDDQRQPPPTTVPIGVGAVDEVYRQLGESLDVIRKQQKDPKLPLSKENLAKALQDFLPRAAAMPKLARTFRTLPMTEIGPAVTELRNGVGAARFDEVVNRLGMSVDPNAKGTANGERRELQSITKSVTRLGMAFPEAKGDDLLDVFDRLRALTGDAGTPEQAAAEIDRLVDRIEELASGDLPMTIFDAIDQVAREENPPGDNGSEAEESEDESEGANDSGEG